MAEVPERAGRVMALDLGTKSIGVAVSDPLGITAQGLQAIPHRSQERDIGEVLRLAREWGVEELVVGLPLRLDGSRGPEAERAERFARRLEQATGLPVRLQDERLTTREAERALLAADLSRRRRRQVIDKTAATLLLQTYLASRRLRFSSLPAEGDQEGSQEEGGEQVGHPDTL